MRMNENEYVIRFERRKGDFRLFEIVVTLKANQLKAVRNDKAVARYRLVSCRIKCAWFPFRSIYYHFDEPYRNLCALI